MKKIFYLLIIFAVLFINCSKKENNPIKPTAEELIAGVINQVNLDSLKNTVEELSGEKTIIVNGESIKILSRHKNYVSNEIAENYFFQRLKNYVQNTTKQVYSETGKNIIAIQSGTKYPDREYIISAHYDAMPDSAIAPGADDDASGCAVVLETARILSKLSAEYTIVYALWDEEEQGLVGSKYYAVHAKEINENIVGLINVDMVGWDSNNDNIALLSTRSLVNSIKLSDKMVEINDHNQIGVKITVVNPGSGSDNIPFWVNGFSAIHLEEDYYNDWNANYHTTKDKISYFNIPYFFKCSKLIIGTFASLININAN
jgi:hypothetical protein